MKSRNKLVFLFIVMASSVFSVVNAKSLLESQSDQRRAEATGLFDQIRKLTKEELLSLAQSDEVMKHLQTMLANASGSAHVASETLPDNAKAVSEQEMIDELNELVEDVLKNYEHINELIDHMHAHMAQLDADIEKEIIDQIDDFLREEIDFISEDMAALMEEMKDEQTSVSSKIEQAHEHFNQSFDAIETLCEFDLFITTYMEEKGDQQDIVEPQEEACSLQEEVVPEWEKREGQRAAAIEAEQAALLVEEVQTGTDDRCKAIASPVKTGAAVLATGSAAHVGYRYVQNQKDPSLKRWDAFSEAISQTIDLVATPVISAALFVSSAALFVMSV